MAHLLVEHLVLVVDVRDISTVVVPVPLLVGCGGPGMTTDDEVG